MTNRRQTRPWPKEDRQGHGERRRKNHGIKRQTIPWPKGTADNSTKLTLKQQKLFKTIANTGAKEGCVVEHRLYTLNLVI